MTHAQYKPSKYGNQSTTVDNLRFASQLEANRYRELKLLLKIGRIGNLVMQKRFLLSVNGELICTYVADFSYSENGKEVVEDCKGFETREYKIKRRLMKAVLGIEIQEIRDL